MVEFGVAFVGSGGADEIEDRLDHAFADRRAAHQALRRHQLGGGHRRLRLDFAVAGRLDEDAALGVAVGIADVDLHQEAIELRLGQRVGAFLLERVLRRQNMERRRQVVARPSDRHVAFLHRLQQRRLGARAGPVDLVRHQQLGEDRPLDEAETAAAVEALLHYLGPENVGGHQVGGELHPQRVEPHDDSQGLDQLGLGEAGNADQQSVSAGEQRHQRLLDHPFLAKDHRADRLARRADTRQRRFGGLHDAGVQIGDRHALTPLAERQVPRPARANSPSPPTALD